MATDIATDSCHCQQLIRASEVATVQPMVAKDKKDFSDRLHAACNDAQIVEGRGRRAQLRRMVEQAGLEVSGESVRKWLAGDSIPSMDNIRYIATALSVGTEWLLSGRGDTHPGKPRSKQNTAMSNIADYGLSEEHQRLIELYDAIPPELRKTLWAMLESMGESLSSSDDSSRSVDVAGSLSALSSRLHGKRKTGA